MPRYRAHITFGAFSYFVSIYLSFILLHFYPTFLQAIGCLGCVILGSIFPDIDTTSKMQRIFFIFSSFALLGSIIFRFWLLFFNLSFITVIVMLLKHRTLTHKIWFISTLFCVFIYIFSFLGFLSINSFLGVFCFLLGAFSHILLDFLF